MRAIVGIQGYVWFQLYQREGKDHNQYLDELLATTVACGIEAFERSIESQEQARNLAGLLKKHGVKAPSIYAGGTFHTSQWKEAVDAVIQRGRWARELGTTIVTVNPNPIEWGKPYNKTDDQLKTQAQAFQKLGEALTADGMSLAYHSHDPEMRCGAREFHHMMQATEPNHVGLCLDTHWVYRGAENSQVALYDIVKMYLPRIRALHIRQSRGGVWTETLCDGDIDYRPLAAKLKEINFSGPLIMEQAIEEGTPRTLPTEEVHRRGRQWVREVFGV